MKATLKPRDMDLLETLTCRVSALTVGQIARLGWSTVRCRSTLHRRLRKLAKSGWLRLHVVNAHPPLPVGRPLFVWKPGRSEPDAQHISQRARDRWSSPARPTQVCVAAPLAASIFGSTAQGLGSLEHLNHDLRLAAVYVHYRENHPRLANLWIGEHALSKAGYRIKDPDAFLQDETGCVLRVIESAGRYSTAQVESFHEHCADNALPYELW